MFSFVLGGSLKVILAREPFEDLTWPAENPAPMQALRGRSGVHTARVTERRELARNVVLLVLSAPELSGVTRPGQFVMAVPPAGERAATALAIYDIEDTLVSLLFFVCGPRTRELSELHAGEQLALVGPLGNGFDLGRGSDEIALVAGGVGIASLLLPVKAVVAAGGRATLYYGARNASLLVDRERFASAGAEVLCATDDGSFGYKGLVTDLAAEHSAPREYFGCGPSPMLRALALMATRRNVRAQLSLEETFACGVGACWGCVVPIDASSAQAPRFPPERDGQLRNSVFARICKEGPVFWADELRW